MTSWDILISTTSHNAAPYGIPEVISTYIQLLLSHLTHESVFIFAIHIYRPYNAPAFQAIPLPRLSDIGWIKSTSHSLVESLLDWSTLPLITRLYKFISSTFTFEPETCYLGFISQYRNKSRFRRMVANLFLSSSNHVRARPEYSVIDTLEIWKWYVPLDDVQSNANPPLNAITTSLDQTLHIKLHCTYRLFIQHALHSPWLKLLYQATCVVLTRTCCCATLWIFCALLDTINDLTYLRATIELTCKVRIF